MKGYGIMPVALLLALLAASILSAATLEDLAAVSTDVVRGTVSNIESEWNLDGDMILTYVTVDIIETIHGSATDSVVLVYMGGTVGDITTASPADPTFVSGEEVAVFLVQMTPKKEISRDTDLWLIGLSAGRWTVAGGMVNRSPYRSRLEAVQGDSLEVSIPLDDFVARVQAAAGGKPLGLTDGKEE